MRRKVIILDAAKPDFQEIKTYVLSQFGREIWNQVFEEFKNTINDIGLYPEAGAEIDELKELFQEPFRIRLVRQTELFMNTMTRKS